MHEFKTNDELGLNSNLDFIEDRFADCITTNELWEIFVSEMRKLGYDNYIVFGFGFGPERAIEIKHHDRFPWISAVNLEHVYASTAKPEIFEALIERDMLPHDPITYHVANSKKAAILGRDFLSKDMPNYEYAKKLWVDCADLNFHSVFCVPYEGHHPLSRHGIGMHSTLHGKEFEALVKKNWKRCIAELLSVRSTVLCVVPKGPR